jgi:hypothetical protein
MNMAHMPREPEAFGEHVARILKRHYPDRSVELAGPLDLILSGKHLGLENLYRMVLHEPQRGVELVENYLERLIEGDTLSSMPLPLSVAKPRIMPRIQPISIFEHLDKEQVAHVPFVNETVIVFVLDMPQMTVSITVEQMMRWGLQVDDLDVIARENLDGYAPDLQIVGGLLGGRPGGNRLPPGRLRRGPAAAGHAAPPAGAGAAGRLLRRCAGPRHVPGADHGSFGVRGSPPAAGEARVPAASVPHHRRPVRGHPRRRRRDDGGIRK